MRRGNLGVALQKLSAKRTSGSAGLDLHVDDVELEPGETKIIGTGVALSIPQGYVGTLGIWSSIALGGISFENVIDPEYQEEVRITFRVSER